MRVDGKLHRALWSAGDDAVEIIDQTALPYDFRILRIDTLEAAARAIRTMEVRGAPLIGVMAAYGLALAIRDEASDSTLARAAVALCETRPTAVNLRHRVDELCAVLKNVPPDQRAGRAWAHAEATAEEEVELCRRIGEHGLSLIEAAYAKSGASRPVNVLTHCNAGWLATVDWGTALAPIYLAHDRGIPVHVWVDETRPRNQGTLTAWELGQHGVPHTFIADNGGGHLMQHGEVDLCIVGTDRTTARGDVCNKIGTYLKALAAHDNHVPFYVAAPVSSIDWAVEDGVSDVVIEARSAEEVHWVRGTTEDGRVASVRVTPPETRVANPAFDVTPARLVTGLITERGVCEASREGLLALYPERRQDGTTR